MHLFALFGTCPFETLQGYVTDTRAILRLNELPVNEPWQTWANALHASNRADNVAHRNKGTTKPYVYFMRYKSRDLVSPYHTIQPSTSRQWSKLAVLSRQHCVIWELVWLAIHSAKYIVVLCTDAFRKTTMYWRRWRKREAADNFREFISPSTFIVTNILFNVFGWDFICISPRWIWWYLVALYTEWVMEVYKSSLNPNITKTEAHWLRSKCSHWVTRFRY